MNRTLSIFISVVFVIAVAGFVFNFTPNIPEPETQGSTDFTSETGE